MEHALDYAKEKGHNTKMLKQINYVQMKKKLILPCEIVGFEGKKPTSCYHNINESSLIDWHVDKEIKEDANASQRSCWETFMHWLGIKKITTRKDFKKME